MKIKSIIIDDEPLARDVLKDHISRLDDFDKVAEFENALEALSYLKQNRVELIFLDVNMPEFSGIDFLRSLKTPPKTIITTAYREYALEGFDLNVIDYLLKPISFDRFIKAIDKYYDSIAQPVRLFNNEKPLSNDAFVYLRDNRKTYKIFLSEILIIESMGDFVNVHTTTKKITPRCSLTTIQNLLPSDKFIRTHNSFIISIDHIISFTSSQIEIGGMEVPVSRKYKNIVMKALEGN